MKKFMKKFGLLLTVVAIATTSVLALTACNDNTATGNKLVIATEAKFDPFEYIDKNGNYTGFDIELIDLLSKKMGYDGVVIKDMEFDAVLGAVSTGNADAAIAGLTINATRKKAVDFTDAYYDDSAQWILTKADDTVFTGTTKEELDAQLVGKKIGVAKGQTGYYYVTGAKDGDWDFPGIKNADVKEYQDIPAAVLALKNNIVECVLADNAVAEEIVAKHSDIKAIKVALTVEAYGIAVKKGNIELANKFNVALKEAKADGSYDKLYAKYFG